jgi:Fe-S-cluster containining protein
MGFNCSGCGKCCQNLFLTEEVSSQFSKTVQKLISEFPYKIHNGTCEKLVDNKCSVYENRPVICKVDEGYKYFKEEMTLDEWHSRNYSICKTLQGGE